MDNIYYLNEQGLDLALVDEKIIVKPKHLISEQIKAYIKENKDRLKAELIAIENAKQLKATLNNQQLHWLDCIASLLKVDSDFLLQHEFIDKYDLVEQLHNAPSLVADLLVTNPKFNNIKKPHYKVIYR